jgi:hypothetical protein
MTANTIIVHLKTMLRVRETSTQYRGLGTSTMALSVPIKGCSDNMTNNLIPHHYNGMKKNKTNQKNN